MRTRDRAAAAVLLLFGLGGVWEAHRLTIGDPSRPGPGFFPFWLALALCAVAVALLLQPAAARHAEITGSRGRYGKVMVTLGAAAAYAAALAPLGFSLTTFLFLLFLFRAIESRGWIASVVIAAGTALASHLVFKVWLGVQLPAGPWGF